MPDHWPPRDVPGSAPVAIDMLVCPDRRSRGLGTALLEAAAEHVRSDGGSELWLSVDHENGRARALYERRGFTAVNERPRPAHWRFTDSDGNVHEGRHLVFDLVRRV